MTDTTEQALIETPAPDAIEPDTTEQVEQGQAESSPAVNDADESAGKPKPKKGEGIQSRIDELTRNWREAERREAQLLDMLRKQQSPAKPQETAKSDAPKQLPKLEDFNYDEAAYQAALFEHASAEAARKVREELKQEENQRKQTERVKSWKTRESEFRAKTPDYEDVAYYAPITDAMAEIIQESDLAPAIAYYLGKNTDEARSIGEMSPVQAARAIGRIEARLEKPSAPSPQPKPVSKAPPPPPRIEAVEQAVTVRADSPESDKLSDEEWVKLRNKQLARKK